MPYGVSAEKSRRWRTGELRNEEYPFSLPTLSMADMEKVQNDSILFFRYLSVYAVAEEVRSPEDPMTEFILEQPRDPGKKKVGQ